MPKSKLYVENISLLWVQDLLEVKMPIFSFYINLFRNKGDELKRNFYIVTYDNLKRGLMGLSSRPSTLQAYEILFRSTMKLVP